MVQDFLVLGDLLELAVTVGASTFALTFYFMAIKDGNVDPSERRFMGAVYFTMRLALVLIVLTELYYVARYGIAAFPLANTVELFVFRWMLIAIIIVNAVLMQFHKMPMWLGPALAGASWYTLFGISVWPGEDPSFLLASSWYVGFLIFMLLFLRFIKLVYLKK